MYNSQIKKKGHRRVKTDISGGFDYRSIEAASHSNASLIKSFRTNIEPRSQIKKQQDSTTRSHTRTPTQMHEYTYNKWFIKPQVRLKRSLVADLKPKENNVEFAYNKLYEEETLIEDRPFLVNRNEKLRLLEQIPVHNLKLLEEFKKNQEMRKKRVPKIIELFLKKKTSPREP